MQDGKHEKGEENIEWRPVQIVGWGRDTKDKAHIRILEGKEDGHEGA